MPPAVIETKKEIIEEPEKEAKKEDEEFVGGICPVAPVLWLFGLHKAKKPAIHGKMMTKDEIMAEVQAQKVNMQWSAKHK